MVHTIHLDDTYSDVQHLLKEIRRCKQGIRFENFAVGNVVPQGYMTAEEFRQRAIAKVHKFCDKHGIL